MPRIAFGSIEASARHYEGKKWLITNKYKICYNGEDMLRLAPKVPNDDHFNAGAGS